MRVLLIALVITLPLSAQRGTAPAQNDPIRPLIEQLTLDRYKATIKGLTQFGDRRAGSDRNRAAIDWIEAQLKSYGCTNTERLKYDYPPPATAPSGTSGTVRSRGFRIPTGVNNDPLKQPDVKLRELNTQPTMPGPREEV